eukprot:94436-Rhodomonas_salina.1
MGGASSGKVKKDASRKGVLQDRQQAFFKRPSLSFRPNSLAPRQAMPSVDSSGLTAWANSPIASTPKRQRGFEMDLEPLDELRFQRKDGQSSNANLTSPPSFSHVSQGQSHTTPPSASASRQLSRGATPPSAGLQALSAFSKHQKLGVND